jgi:acyl-CoA thioesterase FadM
MAAPIRYCSPGNRCEHRVVFAVRSLQIEYLAPALMMDLLEIETQASKVRGASLDCNRYAGPTSSAASG